MMIKIIWKSHQLFTHQPARRHLPARRRRSWLHRWVALRLAPEDALAISFTGAKAQGLGPCRRQRELPRQRTILHPRSPEREKARPAHPLGAGAT